jgi:hypothetical protein
MQNKLIGEGKAGDVIRNLVLEIWDRSGQRADASPWSEFAANIRTLFQYELLPPQFVEARQDKRWRRSLALYWRCSMP